MPPKKGTATTTAVAKRRTSQPRHSHRGSGFSTFEVDREYPMLCFSQLLTFVLILISTVCLSSVTFLINKGLLDTVDKVKPIGSNDWEEVLRLYNNGMSVDRQRKDHESLKRKFNKLKNTKKPTGRTAIQGMYILI
jgi:hypothetical protein